MTSTRTAVIALLERYFELSAARAAEVLQQLRSHHPEAWIYPATVEAIYQGRYRWVSIAQILALWQRRGQINCHFSADYERLLLGEVPEQPDRINVETRLPAIAMTLPWVPEQPGEAFVPAQDQSGLTERLYKTLVKAGSDCAG
ncbi:hypothetical protein [Synechococcus elongatus]|uniref:Uncharacterized protein n=2 Tax=Synechococcus elongatus TaxID=32046 RepID=Q31MI2_SYNE7|nr:hypothetical protein [Synechococcus elongatus]MBD2687526.1 hypothetical protein [Synechococcus elongatus FACHB-1061]ABB57737.1 cell division protein Ftn6 hypothetical protein [Synechococcus elongatus PCC 7942 = FACHB-805]AJD57776.1 hypothetical protein M744_07955 [Synechococcus elongatus UTEX 2973]MBD2586452.1 hypothetical protein [Synechococcus elongatus FACHB-242]MBD2706765.1 hypothetical protein [Synechococcus elongatus PCC 7942 = FACHB-805]